MSVKETTKVIPRPDFLQEANVIRSLDEFDHILLETVTRERP